MTRDDLTALIARVEAATGPDGVLDAEIHRAANVALQDMIAYDIGGWLVGGKHPQPVKVPAYTASLDAAASLVPEGCEWTRHFGANGRLTMMVHGPDPAGSLAQAATPALALTAAALRARLAQMGDDA
jgi:hypothetical protein